MKFHYHPGYHELWSAAPEHQLNRSDSLLRHPHPQFEACFLINNQEYKASPTAILPDLSAHILVHGLDNGEYRMRLIGPRSKGFFINHQNRHTTFILRFHALTLNSLLPFPAVELRDRGIDLQEVIDNKTIDRSLEKLEQRDFNGLLEVLLQLYSPEKKATPLMAAFLRNTSNSIGNFKVGQLASQLGISTRYLRKVCDQHLGLSPKAIQKIQRFSNSLLHKHFTPDIGPAQIAVQAGYYDQSHMIAEYQEFLARTPGQIWT